MLQKNGLPQLNQSQPCQKGQVPLILLSCSAGWSLDMSSIPELPWPAPNKSILPALAMCITYWSLKHVDIISDAIHKDTHRIMSFLVCILLDRFIGCSVCLPSYPPNWTPNFHTWFSRSPPGLHVWEPPPWWSRDLRRGVVSPGARSCDVSSPGQSDEAGKLYMGETWDTWVTFAEVILCWTAIERDTPDHWKVHHVHV